MENYFGNQQFMMFSLLLLLLQMVIYLKCHLSRGFLLIRYLLLNLMRLPMGFFLDFILHLLIRRHLQVIDFPMSLFLCLGFMVLLHPLYMLHLA